MTDADIEETKATLRRSTRQRRREMAEDERGLAARQAAAHFLSQVSLPPDAIVAGYWPIAEEMDVRPVLTRLVDSGQRVCLPVVIGEDAPLQLRLWAEGAALYPAGFGTLAPEESAPVVQPDVVIMPLLGFDRLGTRLGYGGGYYDRTLAILPKRPRLIGYAFACQEIDSVPRAPHDLPLDAVVTEAGYRSFGDAA